MEKTLLVVGASSDMGMKLIAEGADAYGRVLAHYRSPSAGLQALKERLGEKLQLFQADLSQEADVAGMIAEVKAAGSLPDHMVFFAAPPCANGHFHKLPIADFDAAMTVGLRSTILLCQAFLPNMAKQRHGRVVMLLSSILEGTPLPYNACYLTEKYALLGLMRALASEYAPKGITVNGVSPGHTDTKFLRQQPQVLLEKYAAESPMGRLLTVDEVIPAIRFLLSQEAAAVNGQNMLVTFGR